MSNPLYSREERDEHFRDFLSCLFDLNPIKRRALKCQRHDIWNGNTFYCGLVACPCCRALERNKQQKKLLKRYADAERSKMFMLTICFEVVASLDDIKAVWEREQKAMNYLVDKHRRQSRRWASYEMNCFLEIMPFTADEIALAGSDHVEMFNAMGVPSPFYIGTDRGERPVWLVHVHALGHAPDLDWQEVQAAFAERWSHPHQVHVEQLWDTQDKDVSIKKIVAYSVKYAPGRMLAGARRDWPLTWMSDYYKWAYGFSRSYQSFKFSKGPKRLKRMEETLGEALERDRISISPIPFTESGQASTSVVDLPLDYDEPTSDFRRWEMRDWCEANCNSSVTWHWLVAKGLARFVFVDDTEAIAFKLRFSDLLSGGP